MTMELGQWLSNLTAFPGGHLEPEPAHAGRPELQALGRLGGQSGHHCQRCGGQCMESQAQEAASLSYTCRTAEEDIVQL
jgi:hypothetical protein